jgi:phosphoribosyl-AMP cyclohydrolase
LREQGSEFLPKFDSAGLLTAVVQHAETGEVLMVAFMNREALDKTRETGLAHFYSRSRRRLWMKGETSGHVLRVRQLLVDCDQDALIVKAVADGPACHTGARSCFYRALDGDALTSAT